VIASGNVHYNVAATMLQHITHALTAENDCNCATNKSSDDPWYRTFVLPREAHSFVGHLPVLAACHISYFDT